MPEDQEIIKIADGLINGTLYVHSNIEATTYDIDNLDWNIQFSDSPNTFQLYLQCLNPVLYLTRAYELCANEQYMNMADALIKSWNKYLNNSELSSNNPFLWYDHGTALRAENLIYYSLVASEAHILNKNTARLIIDLLNSHADFLSNNQNYTENHNHGIFQDSALIYIAYFLNNTQKDEWINIAKNRLENQKNHAFSSEMVHVENSPGYQIGVMDLFRVISEFLIQFNDDFGATLYNDIKDSAEFMAYIMKPNGYAAEIGDTNGSLNTSPTKNTGLEVFNNDHLTYAATLGEEGKMPEDNSKIYPKSGYYISHNNWEKEAYSDSTWIMFKSGYLSNTHKHADDNSFMLYSKGFDVFADTGWYNYVTGDRYRDYFVSSSSHNTVIVDGKSYSPTIENNYLTGIFDYLQTDNYDYIAGYNDMYNGVMFDRHLYNLGDAVIIYDNIISSDNHEYSQLFHLPEYNKILKSQNNEVVISIGDSGYKVRVQQFGNTPELEIHTGDFKEEKFGYISHSMNDLKSTSTLKYNLYGNNIDFITLITIESPDEIIQGIDHITFDDENRTFCIVKADKTSYKISLTPRERIQMNNFSVNKTGENSFEFVNEYIHEGISYAWYVINKATSAVEFKSDYSNDNIFNYTFTREGEYLIKAYAKDKYNQRKQCIIADILYDHEKNQWLNTTDQYPYLNLEYNGHSYKNVSDNTYEFIIDYNYSWNSQIKWYVYKNGAYYTSFSTENENRTIIKFEEAGKYTVMYYLKTPNGNNEYWNFEQINIQ